MRTKRIDEVGYGFGLGIDWDSTSFYLYLGRYVFEWIMPFKKKDERYFGLVYFIERNLGRGLQLDLGTITKIWSK